MSKSRPTQASVNCIVRCKNSYLFVKRSKEKSIDPGVANIIGGKVEDHENYYQAAIREAREEVGDIDGSYIKDQATYNGSFIFRGGYKKDWIAQFFLFEVESMDLPGPTMMEEGELFWVHKDKFNEIENIIWDLPYCFREICDDNLQFHIIAHLNEKEKPISFHKTVLNLKGEVEFDERIDIDG